MISASNTLKDILKNYTAIKINAGCIFEYNMNSMLDSISVSYPESLDIEYKTHNNSDGTVVDRINKYRKLFPVDSVVQPVRPQSSGIKYFIWTEGKTEVPEDSFSSPRSIEYPTNQARVYYPGVETSYKYWVTPINKNADVTVNYAVQTAKVIEAYSNNNQVVYKTLFPHGFLSGYIVSISGLNTSSFNLSSQVISEVPDQYTFIVNNNVSGDWAQDQNATATLSVPTKSALSNKVVIKFESFHDTPIEAKLYINQTTEVVLPISGSWSGTYEVYFNGSTWSLTKPSVFSTPISINSLRVTALNSGSGKSIGITEISARWVTDLSADLVELSIKKESTDDSSRILPVGYVTANSLNMSLSRYSQDAVQIIEYNKNTNIDTNKIYLYKNVEIKPYFRVYTSDSQYEDLYQGSFFIKDFDISTYGDAQIVALDGAKFLMETIAPEIICENYPVTAIIRRLLDSIGFTNYSINITSAGDKSVPLVNYWYSTNSETVWSMIQDLCRDIQMNAFFDENNVLQFYSRDYIYSKLDVDWSFYYDNEKDINNNIIALANIESISKQEIASANSVQVLFNSPVTSNYLGNSTAIWQAPTTFLGAGGIKYKIEKDSSPSDTILELDLNTFADSYSDAQTLYNFNGYLLIGSEIIEYDAIQYQYVPKNSAPGTPPTKVWVESATDLSKYRWLSEPGFEDPDKPETAFFKPTGRYRVKTRGALNTPREEHPATATDFLNTTYLDNGKWNQGGIQFK